MRDAASHPAIQGPEQAFPAATLLRCEGGDHIWEISPPKGNARRLGATGVRALRRVDWLSAHRVFGHER